MYSSAVLLALLNAPSALASLLPRQASVEPAPSTATFSVTSFSISGNDKTTQVDFAAAITDLNSTSVEASGGCDLSTRTPNNSGFCSGATSLGFLGEQCARGQFSWSFVTSDPTGSAAGLSFQLNETQDDGSVLVGCRLLSADDFACTTGNSNPFENGVNYTGPSAFEMEAVKGPRTCVYG